MQIITRGVALAVLVCATSAFGAVDEKQCAVYRRDAVSHSLEAAIYIDDHLGRVPPEEDKYLSAELAATTQPEHPDTGRFGRMVDRPYYELWWFRKFLAELIRNLKTIDEPAIGESVEAHRIKRGVFSLVAADNADQVFSEYFHLDMNRQYPGLDRAVIANSVISLARMQGDLLWFVNCTVDTMKK